MSLENPNLDDKTFEQFFLEARALIPRYAPQWTDHNFSDPGITFIDLFAWLAEMQIYSANRITPMHKRKFLKYLGTLPLSACPSTGYVTLALRDSAKMVSVPAGTLLFAVDSQKMLFEPYETTESVFVSAASLLCKYYVKNSILYDVTKEISSDNGYFEPFYQSITTEGKLLLGIDNGKSCDPLRIRFELIEDDLPPCEKATADNDKTTSVALRWETWNGGSWQSLTVEDRTCGLNHSGDVVISGMSNSYETSLNEIPSFEMAKTNSLSWISIMPAGNDGEGYEITPRIHSIRLHSVPVVHGQTWRNELHDGTGLPLQQVQLKNMPIIAGTIVLNVDNQRWSEVIDFDASKPSNRHFTVDCSKGIIQFGDGEHGGIPLAGNGNISIESYRSGGGINGNIASGKIVRIDDPEYVNVAIIGSTGATGGAGEESINDALDRARRERKLPTRILSEKDIEDLVLATPGTRIHAVKVLFGYHPLYCSITMPGTITIVAVPVVRDQGMIPPAYPSKGFLSRIRRFLDDKRLITTDFYVTGPEYVPVSVSVNLHIRSGLSSEIIKTAALNVLNNFLNPFTGGPEGKGWVFGHPVVASDIVALLQDLEGVTCVKNTVISSNDVKQSDKVKLPKIGLTYALKHSITIITD